MEICEENTLFHVNVLSPSMPCRQNSLEEKLCTWEGFETRTKFKHQVCAVQRQKTK